MFTNNNKKYENSISYWLNVHLFQTQIPHGFTYDRRSDYSGTIGVGGGGGGGVGGGLGGTGNRIHEHDPLALQQALQSSVDDGQNTGMDEHVGFMSDLPLLKSKFLFLTSSTSNFGCNFKWNVILNYTHTQIIN